MQKTAFQILIFTGVPIWSTVKNPLDDRILGSLNILTLLLSLLAYTDPRIPFILYTNAYDIAIWCFSPKCTLYTCGKYCGTMNDDNLESKALCKVQKFHECSFCSKRRHAAGKLLVYILD